MISQRIITFALINDSQMPRLLTTEQSQLGEVEAEKKPTRAQVGGGLEVEGGAGEAVRNRVRIHPHMGYGLGTTLHACPCRVSNLVGKATRKQIYDITCSHKLAELVQKS